MTSIRSQERAFTDLGSGLNPAAPPPGQPFDGVAETYDRDFTRTALGRELRAVVWRRLAERFPPGSRVLELNCGTGEDAVWLASRGVSVLATDHAEAMLDVARRKIRQAPAVVVELAKLDLANPEVDFPTESFDGAFSGFGGLNCLDDLRPLALRLARWLKPRAVVVLVVMGPFCAWEMVHYMTRLEPRIAFRRWKRTGTDARVGEHRLRVFYPPPARLARCFAPEFGVLGCRGLGVALPPTFLAGAMEHRRRLLRVLSRLESWLSRPWPFCRLGDHYILELARS